jgi:polysaccharide biosynthesis protein PslH
MRIFFVCRRVPFPPDRGDKIATFNQIRHLSTRHEVHVFCLGDGDRDLDNIAGLSDYAKSITAIPVGGLMMKLRMLKALIEGQPLSVAALDEAELHAAIRQKFSELRPDLIIVYSSNVAQFARQFPDTPRIMQFGDLDSLKWHEYAEHSRPPLKWIYGIEERRLLTYERLIARSFSQASVHTETERGDFQQLIPGTPVAVVGNGVDLDYFRSAGLAKRPASIVFTGVMDYRPNVDAIVWFCREVLPLVRAEIAEANLTICGRRPVRPVRHLEKLGGVTVTGWVPDTRPYLDQAEVFVAPLRIARGVQNKLLEALAMGLPCVASVAARSGTQISAPECILATDDPRQFAEYVIQLLRNAEWRAELGRKARAIAETEYGWEAQMAPFDRVIAAAVSRPPRPLAQACLESAP